MSQRSIAGNLISRPASLRLISNKTLSLDTSRVICIIPRKTPRKTGELEPAREKRGALITSFRDPPWSSSGLKGGRYFAKTRGKENCESFRRFAWLQGNSGKRIMIARTEHGDFKKRRDSSWGSVRARSFNYNVNSSRLAGLGHGGCIREKWGER